MKIQSEVAEHTIAFVHICIYFVNNIYSSLAFMLLSPLSVHHNVTMSTAETTGLDASASWPDLSVQIL